jgi:hypothetical protein
MIADSILYKRKSDMAMKKRILARNEFLMLFSCEWRVHPIERCDKVHP